MSRTAHSRRLGATLIACGLFPVVTAVAAPDPRLGPPFELRDRPSLGSPQAPVVVVEFANYRCDHCLTFHQRDFPVLRKQYIDSGRVQWLMVPTSFDAAQKFSRLFALGRCIAAQGKFWPVLEHLMANSHHAAGVLEKVVSKHPLLDQEALSACVRDRNTQRVIDADFREYDALKIRQTPTFLVRRPNADGTHTEARLEGLPRLEYFQRVLDELLKQP